MLGWWLPSVFLVGGGGCSCQPQLPTDDETTPPDTRDTAPPPTGETAAPEGPCPQEEVEPNDEAVIATELAFESRACGAVSEAGDSDWWRFVHEEAGWLAAEVRAGDGAIIDPTLVLNGDGWSAQRLDGPGTLEPRLVFPAPAGEVDLLVTEQRGLGGERYGYTVLVSEAKAPAVWTQVETEPNDDDARAEPLALGDAVLGGMDGNGALPDFDWYALSIPAGRQNVRVAVTAYGEGSSANLTVRLYDRDLGNLPEGCRDPCAPGAVGCVDCAIEGGTSAEDLDPQAVYGSLGSETVFVQVLEAGGREGPAYWYVLSVSEAP
jgi:hypothetical protein